MNDDTKSDISFESKFFRVKENIKKEETNCN